MIAFHFASARSIQSTLYNSLFVEELEMCYPSDRTSVICRVVKLLELYYKVTMLYPYVFVANTSDDLASKVFLIENTIFMCSVDRIGKHITSSRL